MENKANIRIVDIARMAEVSPGTVDRVLHNRGKVSPEKRAKVEKVLKEINYEPNMVARVLASKKSYRFAVISPTFTPGSYWELASNGIDLATAELKKFLVSTEYFRFNQYDRRSFDRAVMAFKEKEFDGVLIATLFGDQVVSLSRELDQKEIPYIYIDSDIPAQDDLSYFGGDSFASGTIAAKLLIGEVGLSADIFFAHIRFRYKDISLQMKTREQGFMDYLEKSGYTGNIHHIEVNPDNPEACISLLEDIIDKNPALIGGIVLNSRIYELIPLLDKMKEPYRNRIKLIGHDAIPLNVEALKQGRISFLLSQRPELQGYDAIKALGNYFLFKQTPQKVNYMPIDILIKENVDFYNNYKL
ncbi:substrate-binding domain-containing protein [Dysgonomonas sp. 511]|uniref:LacI family DNA-binding transcriptional regulator n=1 Tax=Dysgonomonas sp. 511 TaxID=2302930 RepID=UPI0013D14DF9|nr:substrate-binding domain-containing protein [Dysgonomonas sp. 511]NDV78337.1 LacI family DNA-binding transcriptional regulator [Dysgonomonas sp. 511]